MKTPYALVLCLFLAACGAGPDSTPSPNQSEDQRQADPVRPQLPADQPGHPSQGDRTQAEGYYSAGKLTTEEALPWEGDGFTKIIRPRNRQFATQDLIYVITEVAKNHRRSGRARDRIQIGDVSQSGGGPVFGHASHQNGLDADVAYLRMDQTEQDPADDTGFKEEFVKKGKVTKNFDVRRNWRLAKDFVHTGRVQRIFVNDVIKQELCRHAKAIGEFEANREVLRRLRSYTGHIDHLHIRITCPLNSPQCTFQEDPPEATDCKNDQ